MQDQSELLIRVRIMNKQVSKECVLTEALNKEMIVEVLVVVDKISIVTRLNATQLTHGVELF